MERYTCAYRDPKSPLTPLTPLSSCNAFNFDFGGDNSLRLAIDKFKSAGTHNQYAHDAVHRLPKRYSERFLQLRNIFEKPRAAPTNDETTPKIAHSKNYRRGKIPTTPYVKRYLAVPAVRGPKSEPPKQKRRSLPASGYYRASPVPPKPLSPRISVLLQEMGLSRYKANFEQEEIDLNVFQLLTRQELQMLGIDNFEDQQRILAAVRFACKLS